MAKDPIGKLEKGILQLLAIPFQGNSVARTITVTLYKGRTKDGTQTKTFQIRALRGQKKTSTVNAEKVFIQTTQNFYIIRASDLPSDVVLDDINQNTKITDSGNEVIINGVPENVGFAIGIPVVGR